MKMFAAWHELFLVIQETGIYMTMNGYLQVEIKRGYTVRNPIDITRYWGGSVDHVIDGYQLGYSISAGLDGEI